MCSLLLDEAGHVEDLGRAELFLHLIELVCANGVQIPPNQLLLQMTWVVEGLEVFGHAKHVISDETSILFILEVCQLWETSLLVGLGFNLVRWVLHGLSKIFGHYY